MWFFFIDAPGYYGKPSPAVSLDCFSGICLASTAIFVTYIDIKKPLGSQFIDNLYHVVGQVIAAAIILCVGSEVNSERTRWYFKFYQDNNPGFFMKVDGSIISYHQQPILF